MLGFDAYYVNDRLVVTTSTNLHSLSTITYGYLIKVQLVGDSVMNWTLSFFLSEFRTTISFHWLTDPQKLSAQGDDLLLYLNNVLEQCMFKRAS